MNKELINKFRKEFNHWLDGGGLLYKAEGEEHWSAMSDGVWNSVRPVKIVIYDEYVYFRKALSDGEQVQVRIDFNMDGKAIWGDVSEIDCNLPAEMYRIEPQESPLKVGDWAVGENDNLFLIRDIRPDKVIALLQGSTLVDFVYKPQEVTKWVPKEGDTCWFWDDDDDGGAQEYIVAKFNRKDGQMFVTNTCRKFINCAPFVSQLPDELIELVKGQ